MKFLFAFLLLLAPCMSQAETSDLFGCYKLKMSSWSPTMHLGEDDVYITPPQIFALTSSKISYDGPEYMRISPALGATDPIHKYASWREKGVHVLLEWSTGTAGLSMDLTRVPGGLAGEARTIWDFERTVQTSKVRAIKIACRISKGG